jgi:hypothetical protein
MQVADIAWTQLTPRVQQKLAIILNAGEPTFRPYDGNVRDAFRKASTWCDYIKRGQPGPYDEIITKYNTFFEPNMVLEGEGVRCKTWHYYDIPIMYSGSEPKVRPSNALAAMNLAVKELTAIAKNELADPKMAAWWVYWITHVTGDLHQPLHCVSNHSVHSEGDDGGNKYTIKGTTREGRPRDVKLHGFWDGAIGRAIGAERETGLSPNVEDVSVRWAANPAYKAKPADAANLDVMSWLKEGAKLAQSMVYAGISEGTAPSDPYVKNQIELSKKQAVLAGFRLAGILNQAL